MTGPCFNQYLIFSRAVLGLFFRRDFSARFSLKYVSIGLFLVLYGKSVRMLREPEDFAKTHSAKKRKKLSQKIVYRAVTHIGGLVAILIII